MWLCTAQLANLMFMVLSNATGSLQQAKLFEFKVCSYICDIIELWLIEYGGHNIYFKYHLFSMLVCELILDFDFILFCLVSKFYLCFFTMLQKIFIILFLIDVRCVKLKKFLLKWYIYGIWHFFLKWYQNKILHWMVVFFKFDSEWDWVDLWGWRFLKLYGQFDGKKQLLTIHNTVVSSSKVST